MIRFLVWSRNYPEQFIVASSESQAVHKYREQYPNSLGLRVELHGAAQPLIGDIDGQ